MSTGTCYELWQEGCNGGCYVKGKLYFAQQLVFTQFLGHQLLYPAESYICLNVKRTWTRSGGCDCGQGS